MPNKKKDPSLNTGNKNADAISNSATYLEKIPFIGGFFKAARHNVEGHGPGTNDMSAPSSELSGGKYQSIFSSARKGKKGAPVAKRK